MMNFKHGWILKADNKLFVDEKLFANKNSFKDENLS